MSLSRMNSRQVKTTTVLSAAFQYGILFLCCFSAASTATDFSQLFNDVDNGVVVLHTYSSESDTGDTSTSPNGLGTGSVISASGKILTAAHVVQTADSVHVEFRNGEKILGTVIASEPTADLAILQLSRIPNNMTVIKMGDSDNVTVGQEIIVIGSPYGLEHTLTVGHISARYQPDQLAGPFFQGEFFQTDAAINQGNSGGPVINKKGELVGVVSHMKSKSGGNEGLGFAITSNTAQQLIHQGANFWSGLTATPINETLAIALNYPREHGALVQAVAFSSPAEQAGIKAGTLPAIINGRSILLGGDIIVAIEGIAIKGKSNYKKIIQKIARIKQGADINVTLYQHGTFRKVTVTKP